MKKRDKSGKPKQRNSGRISLHPLSVEDALRGFMSVDPTKIKKPTKRGKRDKS